ncbi:MAG: AraC family transcriptional regulator [Planctomycetota bacterium]
MSALRKNISGIDFRPPERVVVLSVDYAPGGECGPRTQRDVQLVMLDRGSLRVETDGRVEPVFPGDVIVQWPGGQEHYVFDSETASSHRWIALTYDDSPETRRWLAGLRAAAPRRRRESGVMRRLFDMARAMTTADDAETVTARNHLAWAYFEAYLVGEPTDADIDTPRMPPALSAMQAVIAEHSDEPMTLDDLAAAASVSPNHLARLCRKHLNTTPMRLLWDRRVERGVELLRNTGLNVSEIAYRVGFANPFHFSRLCKARHGVSPRELRQRVWSSGKG